MVPDFRRISTLVDARNPRKSEGLEAALGLVDLIGHGCVPSPMSSDGRAAASGAIPWRSINDSTRKEVQPFDADTIFYWCGRSVGCGVT